MVFLQAKEEQEAKEVEMKVGVVPMEGDGGTEAQGKECCDYTLDGSVDLRGSPAIKGSSGGWVAGVLLLGN